MNRSASLYKRHRFPPEIIQHTVWLYYRFNLSCRDIEDLLAERGIVVSYESIRLWCIKFGPRYARRLKRRHQGYGDTGQRELTTWGKLRVANQPLSRDAPQLFGLKSELSQFLNHLSGKFRSVERNDHLIAL
jgi:hypothetical protein